MYENIITLMETISTADQYGGITQTISTSNAFVSVKSISQTEFWQAQSSGLKPEIKFLLKNAFDYHGQKRLKYTPFGGVEDIYTVIRTYQDKDSLELVCKRGVDE